MQRENFFTERLRTLFSSNYRTYLMLKNRYFLNLLFRYRKNNKNFIKAAFLSARNDVLANCVIIGTGFIIMIYPSIWPDLIAGLIIFLINFDAAYKVYQIANAEDKNLIS